MEMIYVYFGVLAMVFAALIQLLWLYTPQGIQAGAAKEGTISTREGVLPVPL